MTTYFVKNVAGDLGSDGNTGLSDGQAFLTLAKLSNTALLNAGDTVKLKAGSSWAENLSIRGTGSPGLPITFTSYGAGNRPIISACDVPTGWVLDSAVAGGDRYKKTALGWTPLQCFREDTAAPPNGVTRNLLLAASLAACTALHNWWYTGADLYVVVATGEAPNVSNVTIHVGRRDSNIVEFTPGQDYITLDSLIIRFTNDNTGTFSGINCNQNSTSNTGWLLNNLLVEWAPIGVKLDGQGTNSFNEVRVCTMTNCEVRFCHSHGVNFIFLSAGSLVDNCKIWGNGRQGMGFAARNSAISRCTFQQNGNALAKWTVPLAVQGFDHGLYVVGQVPNFDRAFGNIIRDSIAWGNAKAGMSVDALSSNHTFLRCTSYGNTLYGFMLEGGTTNSSSGNKLYHCTAWNNTKSGLHCINCHGPFDARDCQFYFNGRSGNSQDIYIEWNIGSWTLHSGTNGVDAIYKHQHIDYTITAVGNNSHVILTQVGSIGALTSGTWFFDGAAEGTLYVRDVGSVAVTNCWCDPGTGTWQLDYNNYTPVAEQLGGHSIFRYTYSVANNVSGTTLATLQGTAAMGTKEVHGQQVSPLFADSANGSVRLLAGSPSRDAGGIITGINDGAAGSIRFRGAAPDIGASEDDPAPGTVVLTTTAPRTQWIGQQTSHACDAVFQILGTWTGTISFQCCTDGNDASPVALAVVPAGGGAAVTSTAVNGLWRTVGGLGGGVKVSALFTPGTGVPVVTTVASDWN